MADDAAPFPIVGIGASAGGIEALDTLFAGLGLDGGLAYVVVTHISADRESLLHEVLARLTPMPVMVAAHGMRVEPGHIYVLPARAILGLQDGCLTIREQDPVRRERNPIDLFFSDLAKACGEYAIGIILSGGGTDGTLGIKAIKERGGLTFAQVADGTAPRHPDMPASAIATGLIDFALPADEIAAKLLEYARSFGVIEDLQGAAAKAATAEIYGLLREQIGHDFSGYKPRTFIRRVQRRMQIARLARVEDYVERLRQDGDEVTALFRDLLINVTNFFRDSSAFEVLKAQVLPRLFEGRGAGDTIRAWVPGCATGEEVYSLAMLMRELMDGMRSVPRVQIFATDIDDLALGVARAGRYPEALLDTVSPERRKRFFTSDGGSYVITKEVRELCVFSPHSVIRDPPFSRIDLVSCRNLLIYFGQAVQAQVIPIFHYALRPRGYLFLGTAENISQFTDLFTTVERKHRIFQARETDGYAARLPLTVTGTQPAPFGRTAAFNRGLRSASPMHQAGPPLRQLVESHVIERFASPHVVVDRDGDIVHYSPRTGKYLEAPVGLPSCQLLTLARRGLRLDLRSALREAIETRRPARRDNLAIEGEEGRVQLASVTVEPLMQGDGAEPLLLVLFHDQGPSLSRAADEARDTQLRPDTDVLQLERELRDTRERLQTMIEEYETALEELKSSNEELISVNEELQSTNEELEASKEELQSLNEELQTVNSELSGKIDDLDRANGDLRNLFNASGLATVFLDRNLVIRTFTPAVAQFVPIQEGDRGRPLTDFALRPAYPDLAEDLRSVLSAGQDIERRIEPSGETPSQHHLVRIVPYRVQTGAIAGVVVTFVAVPPAG
ncbi:MULTISPECIES: CheR family methyltransferase [unclassified Methylobacterium]|uniref:CheR family methyltransferase n=1 Tax=unclassified Methylobacterium TaxID=2615210 RepID=UPI0011C1D5E5|nr:MULTISPECIES: CheR family methyltransferase [unclassified Methylobacterium]QEE41201.1 chemotaxis protein CheR [Methylobacterium sp. WL1]TXN54013.1 chemotaxis protein CheR [Methylobacterium sp. WL2]